MEKDELIENLKEQNAELRKLLTEKQRYIHELRQLVEKRNHEIRNLEALLGYIK